MRWRWQWLIAGIGYAGIVFVMFSGARRLELRQNAAYGSYPTTELLQALGAWGEKKLYGKTSMGTLRKTFVFAADGTLERIIEKVDTKNHSEQVLG